jgi:RimJ/RimL family protein N-acetyltransferase
LIDWAFDRPACRCVVAPGTLKSNLASLRVLEKVGMSVYEESEIILSYRITRQDWLNQDC